MLHNSVTIQDIVMQINRNMYTVEYIKHITQE